METKLKMMIAVVNNKGGVAKTTTVQNLAAGMMRKDKKLKILVVDLDPQCNLTLLMHAPQNCATIFESMVECKGLPVYKNEIGVYFVPGSAKMQDIDPFLQKTGAPRQVFGACLDSNCIDMTGEGINNPIDFFDYILIDCPPALSKNTYNALVAASKVLVPVQMEALSVKGVDEILGVMEEVKEFHMNDNLEMLGLLPVMVDERTNITKELKQLLSAKHGTDVLPCRIRRCVKLVEAQACGKSIFEYAPYSSAGIDYEKAIKIMFNI